MKFTAQDLRHMIDFTILHNNDTPADIADFAAKAREGEYAAAFVMPCHVEQLTNALKGCPTHSGAPIAFPTGAEPTQVKVDMVRYHVSKEVEEVDFVINIGWIKAGMYAEQLEETKRIVEAAEGRIVKAIIEVTCLTDEEIEKVSKTVVEGGATFVKTGTGMMPNPTTVHHVEVIHNAIGDTAQIKASGGVRDVETVIAMRKLGVTRFGIGWTNALKILEQFEEMYPDGVEI